MMLSSVCHLCGRPTAWDPRTAVCDDCRDVAAVALAQDAAGEAERRMAAGQVQWPPNLAAAAAYFGGRVPPTITAPHRRRLYVAMAATALDVRRAVVGVRSSRSTW